MAYLGSAGSLITRYAGEEKAIYARCSLKAAVYDMQVENFLGIIFERHYAGSMGTHCFWYFRSDMNHVRVCIVTIGK